VYSTCAVFTPVAKVVYTVGHAESHLAKPANGSLTQDVENGVEDVPHITGQDDHRVWVGIKSQQPNWLELLGKLYSCSSQRCCVLSILQLHWESFFTT